MGLPNLKLRDGSYHWRRKITVSGAALPMYLSFGTMSSADLPSGALDKEDGRDDLAFDAPARPVNDDAVAVPTGFFLEMLQDVGRLVAAGRLARDPRVPGIGRS